MTTTTHALTGPDAAPAPRTAPATTEDRIGDDIPACCPSVITGRVLGMDAGAAVALVEHVLIDPCMAELVQG